MKRTCIVLFILVVIAGTLHGEDYQYQYFSKQKDKDRYTPFSDYIPQVRLHYQTVPHYLEDYYELYGMKMHYNENSLRKNIERLKTSLQCKFRHPSQALVKIETEPEYFKYRNLMFMHINLLIMRSYLSIGSRYDMRNIRFYHWDYAKDISDSLDTAEKSYAEALPYWEKAREYADKASQVKITTDLGFIETERKRIILGDLDFGKIIADYRTGVRTKKQKLTELMTAYQKFQKKSAPVE